MKDVLARLEEISGTLTVTLSPAVVYPQLLEHARGLINATYGSIFLWNGNKFQRVYTTVPSSQLVNPRNDGFIAAVFATQEPCFLSREEILKINPQLSKTKIKMRVIIPLLYDKKTLGIISLRSITRESLTYKELKALKLFGAMVSVYIYKMQLHQHMMQEEDLLASFINLAAHELRTPLTSLNIYLSLMRKRQEKILPVSSDQQLLRRIMYTLHRLTKIVNEFSTLNAIEEQEKQSLWKKAHLRTLLTHVVNQFTKDFPKKSVFIEKNTLPQNDFIKADKEKLQQAFYNLLAIAGDMSVQSKKMSVKLSYEDPYFFISITGGSFSKETKEKKSADSSKEFSDLTDGSRMGLFLIKSIIEQHKGFLSISTTKLQRITITIKLPKIIL